jgi:hypothetical protein
MSLLSRAFAKLKEEGAVELRARKVHVANLEALRVLPRPDETITYGP